MGAVCGGDAVEFLLEVLREGLGVVEADSVGDLGDGELAFLEQFGGAPEAYVANKFDGCFSGEEQQAFVESAAAGVELRAELADGEIGVAHVFFDVLQDVLDESLISGFDLQRCGRGLHLALIGFSNGG